MGNKVKFGLKNVHYSVITVTNGVYSYGTPVRIPGAVNLNLPPVGDKTEFYADDEAYFVATANQGYEGPLEIALIPDSFRTDVLKEKTDASGALFENANELPAEIALLFEFSGDKNATRHVLYKCSVARPEIRSKTKEKNIEVQAETLNLTASPLPNGDVKAKAKPTDSCYDGWYDTVYLKDAPTNAVAEAATYTKSSATDLVITYTTTATAHTVKDVLIDGVSVGGINVTVDTTAKTVTISDTYLDTYDVGNYVVTLIFSVGNAVNVALEIKGAA